MNHLGRFKEPWMNAIKQSGSTCSDDFPSYPCSEPESLVSTSNIVSFEVGTGASIYTRSLLPAIFKAEYEVILVTCFWAPSSTLDALRETLEQLARLRADHIRRLHPAHSALPPLEVRICFSSRSFFQKLFHTWSKDGYTYPSLTWVSKLGLPDPKLLEAGLINLHVKSLFFLPFSVMHPKYLIVDRQRAWLPSANVSWEPWLEGCVEITGNAVTTLLRFYRSVWDRKMETDDRLPASTSQQQQAQALPSRPTTALISIQSPATHLVMLRLENVPTILLPSSHHLDPQFRPLPWQRSPHPPLTPLNCAILRLIAMAEKRIYIQTPNLTSAAVIDALFEALNRGIDVVVITSKGVMILEQILTSGTTTSWCLRSFVKRYEKLTKSLPHSTRGSGSEESNTVLDLEGQPPRPGSLEILYFHPLRENRVQQIPEEPVHSHLKLVMVDDEYIVLGSGNQDRASWFTSQELGIFFQSHQLVNNVNEAVSQALRGRLSLFFKSGH
ncbi:hypothetical protein GGR55DRAFT_432147 [Xylaria sp. FL0064]|nr:hypothetical protein GGR55DRAFT_432147 [Xylaria sp. FL0064]